MIDNIANPSEDPRLDRLNQKINEYNRLSQQGELNSLEQRIKFSLLEEIHLIGGDLKQRQLDATTITAYQDPDIEILSPIMSWSGITKELAKSIPHISSGYAAEIGLIQINKSTDPLPTSEQWLASNTTSSFYFLTNVSPQAQNIVSQLQELHVAKQNVGESDNKAIEYFYKLKQFKTLLLTKLAYELTEPEDIRNYRNLLGQVNNEINNQLDSVLELKLRAETHLSYAGLNFAQQIASAAPEITPAITQQFQQRESFARADVIAILPGLADYEITRLGGGNNINWKLSNSETGEQFVVRIEAPHRYQAFLNQLHQSRANEYFSDDFFSSQPTADHPYALVVSEFANGGDLRHERESMLSEADDNTLTMQACNRLGQLTDFCQAMRANNGLHTDIKLTNFLLNKEGKLIVADKKGLLPISENGTFPMRSLEITDEFAPPEYRTRARDTPADPEAFMSYQIGLALYDYLIMPQPGDDWFAKNPLDFDHPYFASEVGQKMQVLIAAMTNADPQNRPDLATIQEELSALSMSALMLKNAQNNETAEATQTASPSRAEQFQNYKSSNQDQVSAMILTEFKKSLGDVSSIEEMQEKIAQFKASDPYVRLTQNSDASRTVASIEKIIEEATERVMVHADADARPAP